MSGFISPINAAHPLDPPVDRRDIRALRTSILEVQQRLDDLEAAHKEQRHALDLLLAGFERALAGQDVG